MLRIMNSSFNCVPVLYINNATILIWVTLPERSDGPGLVLITHHSLCMIMATGIVSYLLINF
jgi:hypothetical protein